MVGNDKVLKHDSSNWAVFFYSQYLIYKLFSQILVQLAIFYNKSSEDLY